MENCPNCGAATRPGARFCTKCGRRLTPTDTASAEITGAAAPSAPSSFAPAWDPPSTVSGPTPSREEPEPTVRHGSEEPSVAAEADAIEPRAGREEPVADDDRPLWSTSPSGSSWSGAWPGVEGRPEANTPETATPVPATGDWPVPDVEPRRDAPASDDDSNTNSALVAGDEGTAVDATLTAAEPSAESLWDVLPAEDMPPHEDIPAAAPSSAGGAIEPAEPDAGTGPDGPSAPAVDAALSAPETVDAVPAAPVMALLVEIRDLVAGLVGAGSAAGVDLGAVAVELASARAAGAESADRFADLRQVLSAAQDRPRDLGTAVALVDRLETIQALVRAHDRATAAIDRALATLLGDPDATDDADPAG